MKKLKHIKLYENFGKLNESVNENWVVKPYEFKTPEDWQEEFKPECDWRNVEINSNTNPPQAEVDEFESYLDGQVDERSGYGSEDTFENIIENLLIRSFEEMFKVKEPNCGSYFWMDNFFQDLDPRGDGNWHKQEDKIKEIVGYFMSDFSSDKKFERDMDAYRGGYEESDMGEYSGTADFKGTEVFSWSSGGDGYDFSGSLDNADMLYKEIKDYLTMVLYM
jgi:hypothetical protein